MVIIVIGLPGSGKSYFATRLAELINATLIKSDEVRNKLYQHKTYSSKEKQSVYDYMLHRTKDALRENNNIILDGTFFKSKIRNQYAEKIKNNRNLIFIEVTADEKLIKERLQHKRADSDADFEVYQNIRKQWEPLKERHLVLQSTNDNIDIMLNQALDYIRLNT